MKRYEYISIEVPGRLRELAERLKMQQLGDSGWLVLSTSTIQIDRRFDDGRASTEALLMREVEAPAESAEQLLGMDVQPAQSIAEDHECDKFTEEALQSVDAAMFSGDGFEHADDMARLRYFMARWTREIDRRQTVRG